MQRTDEGIADKNGVLISATPQFNPIHALWLFDNGGDILLMRKPELVTIGKDRLIGISQQCERMDETTLREQLESLVRIYFIRAPRQRLPSPESPKTDPFAC